MPFFANFTYCLALAMMFWGSVVPARAQDFDRAAMQAEMRRLGEICQSIDLTAEANISRSWLAPQRSDQRELYLPVELIKASTIDSRQASWLRLFNAARVRYAAFLFAQAKVAVESDDEESAFRLLWQVLREDPEHADAKRILGTLATAATVKPRLRKATSAQPDFGWTAGTYSRVQTPHFLLTTRADARSSVLLATRLEQFYALWRQVYYPLWATPGALKSKFAGRNIPWERPKEMNVTLLADRDEYLRVLAIAEQNAAVSVGYYSPRSKQSFFYPDQDLEATLFHELTHQLFAEASSMAAQSDAGNLGGVWLLEGMALYMESLTEQDHYWTLGGIESTRLQTARYRALRDGYWVDWSEFTSGSSEAWKQDPQIAQLYTQSAGLTHLFMDHLPQPAAQNQLLKSLVSVYQNAPEFSELRALLVDSAATLQREDTAVAAGTPVEQFVYQKMLTLTDMDIQRLVESHSAGGRKPPGSLVLAGSELSMSAWQALAALAPELEWLDLSFSNAKLDDLEWLNRAVQLQRLSVEGTYVDSGILSMVKKWPELKELDLSGCAIDDRALQQLSGHPTLETLWLTKTKITDAALAVLAKLPNLQHCDVEGTAIETHRWQEFAKKHLSVP